MSLEKEAPAARLWRSASWSFILSVLLLMTLIAFEFFAVTTVLPVVAADLGGAGWYSLAAAATVSTGLIGLVVGGNWADRSGTSIPLAVGGLLFLGGVALCALAPSMMVFALVLTGAFIALVTLLRQSGRHPAVQRPTLQRPATAIFGRRGLLALLASATLVIVHVGGQQQPWLAAVVVPAGVALLAFAALKLLPPGTLRLRIGVPRLVGLRALLGAGGTASEVYLVLYMQQHRDVPRQRTHRSRVGRRLPAAHHRHTAAGRPG